MENLLENSYREVAKGGYAKSHTEPLGVDHLGTCLGIGVYDSKSGTTYLMHASTLENDNLGQQIQ